MPSSDQKKQIVLLFSAFIIAICGLIYELLAGTLSSYLLGDSIYHFSLVIGIFMSAMGLGAWLSRYIDQQLPAAFIQIQILIGLIGGLATTVLFYAFAIIQNYSPILFLTSLLLGALLGIEIPLIIRILKDQGSLKLNVSNVFTADYIGALIAALLFPLVFVPHLGLMRTGLFFGLLNIAVGALAWQIFRAELTHKRGLIIKIVLAALVLLLAFLYSQRINSRLESKLYRHSIIYSETTPYQRVVVTSQKQRIRFYINGALQFDSLDEYRYHETLVHPAMQMATAHENILILGGGDGLAAREVMKYPDVKTVTLVDLDPVITRLFRKNLRLRQINKDSLNDPRIQIINQDGWKYIEQSEQLYDVVIIDLPDPSNLNLSRLYSRTFYRLVQQHLSRSGVIVTQASSPLYSRAAYWSVVTTLQAAGQGTSWHVHPYHTYVPSFGEWGFVLATRTKLVLQLKEDQNKTVSLKYLNDRVLQSATYFPADMSKADVEINTIYNHRLLKYYQQGWVKWFD